MGGSREPGKGRVALSIAAPCLWGWAVQIDKESACGRVIRSAPSERKKGCKTRLTYPSGSASCTVGPAWPIKPLCGDTSTKQLAHAHAHATSPRLRTIRNGESRSFACIDGSLPISLPRNDRFPIVCLIFSKANDFNPSQHTYSVGGQRANNKCTCRFGRAGFETPRAMPRIRW